MPQFNRPLPVISRNHYKTNNRLFKLIPISTGSTASLCAMPVFEQITILANKAQCCLSQMKYASVRLDAGALLSHTLQVDTARGLTRQSHTRKNMMKTAYVFMSVKACLEVLPPLRP